MATLLTNHSLVTYPDSKGKPGNSKGKDNV